LGCTSLNYLLLLLLASYAHPLPLLSLCLLSAAVALVLCLNIGVDPPDVIKISPCARLECWVDPLSMQPAKALETIGVGGER
jgi:hypothetical protein